MTEACVFRGTAHLGLSLWGLTLTLLRTRDWFGPGTFRCGTAGGCWIGRAGPVVLTYWRGK